MDLPESFCEQIEKRYIRMQTRRQHLLLLNHEGLDVLERWRTERHLLDYTREHTQ